MIKLGIIGAENSHCWQIGKVCNIDKAVAMRVPVLWGERATWAKESAEKGGVPAIVKDWREMVGQVDGVMIDHRHPGPHYEVAKYMLEHKVPCFVDKPFTYKLREAQDLLATSKKKRTPVMTFSAMPTGLDFQAFKKSLKKCGRVMAVNSTGRADLKSKYGGIFFYGIHQVDGVIELIGNDPKSVFVHKNLPNAVASITFRSGAVATVNVLSEGVSFHWSVETEKGVQDFTRTYGGPNPYITSAKIIQKFLKTGKSPYSDERMLATIAVLEAMEKAIKTGKVIRVAKF